MDEEEKKEQGAVKQGLDNASNKGKEIAKEKAKNEVKKGIFNLIKAFIGWKGILIIALVLVLLIMVLSFAWLLTGDTSEESKDAAVEALVYNFSTVPVDPDDADIPTDGYSMNVSIDVENMGYKINYSFYDEEGNEISEEQAISDITNKLLDEGKDVSLFTKSELKILAVLDYKGLKIKDYSSEELKCFPLFLKADIASGNFDLRTGDELGKEIDPEAMVDSDLIYGSLQAQKTSVINNNGTTEYETTPLEFMAYGDSNTPDSLAYLIAQKDTDEAIKHFTLDEDGNLIVVNWGSSETNVSYLNSSGGALSDADIANIPDSNLVSGSSTNYLNLSAPIAYQENAKLYKMNYGFLSDLLLVTRNPKVCAEISRLAFNNKMVIGVKEELTTITTVTDNIYHDTTLIRDHVDYIVNGEKMITTSNNVLVSSGSTYPTPSSVGHGYSSSYAGSGNAWTASWTYGVTGYSLTYYDYGTPHWSLYRKSSTTTTEPVELEKKTFFLIDNGVKDNIHYTTKEEFDYDVRVTTTTVNNDYEYEVSTVDCWFLKYDKKYEDPPAAEVNNTSNSNSVTGEYSNEVLEDADPDSDQEVKKFCDLKVREYATNPAKNIKCEVSRLQVGKKEKTDKTVNYTSDSTSFSFGEVKPDTTKVRLKNVKMVDDVPVFTKTYEDEDGNEQDENGFLNIYDKYIQEGEDLFLQQDAEEILWQLLEESESEYQNGVYASVLKYLLYVYDGIDRGETNLDPSIFTPRKLKLLGVSKNMAVVEFLRSYEYNILRLYRNGRLQVTDAGVQDMFRKKHIRINPDTGEEEYGFEEMHYKSDNSLNYSYGILVCPYVNGVAGELLSDKVKYFTAHGIDLSQKVAEYSSSNGGGWVNADTVDEIQVEMINDVKKHYRKYFRSKGVELTNNELDAVTVISYGHGNCYVTDSTIQLILDYKAGTKTQEDVIKGFLVPLSEGGYFHPFTYGDWVDSGRADGLIKMFFEGRYICFGGEEIFPSLLDDWDGPVYESKDFIFPLYSQHDEVWKDKPFGGPNGAPEVAGGGYRRTIGTSGCGTVALSVVMSGFTSEAITPPVMVDILDEVYPSGRYYAPGDGSRRFYYFDNENLIAARFSCVGKDSTSKPEAEKALKNGDCAMLGITRYNGTQHVVAAVPVSEEDEKQGYLFKLIDPTGPGMGYDGLYKSFSDLVYKNGPTVKGSEYAISTVDVEAIINRGTNVSTKNLSIGTGGIKTQAEADALEKKFSQMLSQPGPGKPSNKGDPNLYNNLLPAFKAATDIGLEQFQCTWWAYGRATLYLSEHGTKIKEYPTAMGHGGAYYRNNVNGGWFDYGPEPRVNSIGSYGAGVDGNHGHVFYVEGVTRDGIYVSECGGGVSWYGVSFWSNAVLKSKGIHGYIYLDSPK